MPRASSLASRAPCARKRPSRRSRRRWCSYAAPVDSDHGPCHRGPMSAPRLIAGLSEIARDHDALICDIWGVVHNGHAPFSDAAEALRRFRHERGRVVLLSNAPRMPDSVVEQFRRIGVANDFYDAIVTSGGATREDLIRRGPLSLYYIGPDWDRTLLDGLSIKSTS